MISNDQVVIQMGIEAVKNKTKINALIELLVEKGILNEQELNDRANKLFDEKAPNYLQEILDLSDEDFKKFVNKNK